MALSAFFLVSTEDHRARCRTAGWIYLIATHIGTLTLFAMFALWRWATGSYELTPVAAGMMSAGVRNSLFLLALVGFGLKAGMMPLHFWLPTAHANAPSHVSAMLSGVVLKIGIYGLVRMLSLLPNPPVAWAGLILLLASVSALLGVVFAIGQHDLKRLLAYHSVENIGIILMGLGVAMLGAVAAPAGVDCAGDGRVPAARVESQFLQIASVSLWPALCCTEPTRGRLTGWADWLSACRGRRCCSWWARWRSAGCRP